MGDTRNAYNISEGKLKKNDKRDNILWAVEIARKLTRIKSNKHELNLITNYVTFSHVIISSNYLVITITITLLYFVLLLSFLLHVSVFCIPCLLFLCIFFCHVLTL
jgi:hypothetical protein